MAEPSDLFVAAALIDEVELPGGRSQALVPGGAGLYALAGGALWSRDPVLVSGAGEDAPSRLGPWFKANGLSMRGMRARSGPTPVNRIVYRTEDERSEEPLDGAEQLALMHPTADDIAAAADGARSAYVFSRLTDGLVASLSELRARRPFTVLWEIALDAATPDNLPAIRAALKGVDAFSLNLEEAGRLFGDIGETALLARLADLGAPITYLRLGSRGSTVITRDGVTSVPSLPVPAVDVTGGGNAYSGGALAALAAGDPPVTAAIKATVSAALCVSHQGVFNPGDPSTAAKARNLLSSIHAGQVG